jgi:hypothetical protein
MTISTEQITDFENTIRDLLAITYGVEPKRITVRIMIQPVDEQNQEGRQRLSIGLDLDGKDPPPAWGAMIEDMVQLAARVAC